MKKKKQMNFDHNKYPIIVGGQYLLNENKFLELNSFFNNRTAILESCDLTKDVIELRLACHIPLYWRGTYEMFINNWSLLK